MSRKSIMWANFDVICLGLIDAAEWQEGIAASLVGTDHPADVSERKKATKAAIQYRKLHADLSK